MRTFRCPSCDREVHILRRGNAHPLLNLAGFVLGGIYVWPGSCRECVGKHRIAVFAVLAAMAVLLAYVLVT